jgi:hypothetical protein
LKSAGAFIGLFPIFMTKPTPRLIIASAWVHDASIRFERSRREWPEVMVRVV